MVSKSNEYFFIYEKESKKCNTSEKLEKMSLLEGAFWRKLPVQFDFPLGFFCDFLFGLVRRRRLVVANSGSSSSRVDG